MNWSKKLFNSLIWLLYVLIVGSCVICFIALLGNKAGKPVETGIILGILYLCFPGIVAIIARKLYLHFFLRIKISHRCFVWIERIYVLALFLLDIYMLKAILPLVVDPSGYFEMARVTADYHLPTLTHGAEYFYVAFLHGVCILFGNQFFMAVISQFILHMGAIIFLYIGFRKTLGRITTMVMLSLFLPVFIKDMIYLSPRALFVLLYALLVFAFSKSLEAPRFSKIRFAILGFLIGFLVYLDILGITLLCFATLLVIRKQRIQDRIPIQFLKYLIMFICSLLSFCGCLLIDAFVTGQSFWGIFKAWMGLYQPTQLIFHGFVIPDFLFTGYFFLWMMIVFGLLSFGITSYFFSNNNYKFVTICLTLIMLIAGLCFDITSEQLSGIDLLLLYLSLLCGYAINNIVTPKMVNFPSKEMSDTTEEIPMKQNDFVPSKQQDSILFTEKPSKKKKKKKPYEKSNHKKEVKTMDYQKSSLSNVKTEVPEQFIPNPLPVPKKHEKKVLEYDYFVADDDDFDI